MRPARRYLGDDFCSFSGIPVGFQVSGTNSIDTAVDAQSTDLLGNVSFTYPDTADVEGQDNITTCADLPASADSSEATSTCISDNAVDGADVVSNTVTKNWIAAISGTITLAPASAVNNPAAANQHTVTATVSGVERCSVSHNLCSDNSDCNGGADTCSDKSGVTVGFEISSGPKASQFPNGVFTTTDATGTATFTYSHTGGAGSDSIQGCLDGDAFGAGSPDENTPSVAECISDANAGGEADFASNTVTKRWDPQLALKNLDAGATLAMGSPVYTSNPAFNPVGSTHTVRASITNAATICFTPLSGTGSRTACKTTSDCSGTDTCGLAGYPVWFSVLAGSQNPGDLNSGNFVNTDSSGNASATYTDTNGAGFDTIQACVDADLTDGIPDDTAGGFTESIVAPGGKPAKIKVNATVPTASQR